MVTNELIERILEDLQSEEFGQWKPAQDALVALRDPRAVPLLLEIVRSGSERQELVALKTLAMLAPVPASLLLPALRAPEARLRKAAAWHLGHSRDPAIAAPLVQALEDPEAGVRSSAAHSLGILKDSRAVAPLIRLLQDPDRRVRNSAAESLGEYPEPRVVDALIAVVRGGPVGPRRSAATSLGKLRAPRAVGPLLELLAKSLARTGGDCIEALGDLGDSRAVDPLLKLLPSLDRVSKQRAVTALTKLKAADRLQQAGYAAEYEREKGLLLRQSQWVTPRVFERFRQRAAERARAYLESLGPLGQEALAELISVTEEG